MIVTVTLILILRGAGGPLALPMPDMQSCMRAARNYLPIYSGTRLFVEAACLEHATGNIAIIKPDVVFMP